MTGGEYYLRKLCKLVYITYVTLENKTRKAAEGGVRYA
jgi:hypothetical protein